MNPIQELHSLGQSIWYDNIERRLIKNGNLALMIENDIIRGITSNPSIFKNAITQSSEYEDELIPLAEEGTTKQEIYEVLAIKDIQAACDLFRPLHEKTRSGDGYVSLEVNPYLANDAQASVDEAERLWRMVDRPNLMIKIPATNNGLLAVYETIAAGINVNVTLIFSIEMYQKVAEAYLAGLEKRLTANLPSENISSVASFFISRIDTNIDTRLAKIIQDGQDPRGKAENLQGRVAVANAKIAYDLNKGLFISDRFRKLKASGGRVQRVLWASTSTKNPNYPDTKYVDELIGINTINTIPPMTLKAFEDHGKARITIEEDLDGAKSVLKELELLGILISEVTDELEKGGVKSFADDFTSLLDSIEERRLAVKR